jgi:hypothetical protein
VLLVDKADRSSACRACRSKESGWGRGSRPRSSKAVGSVRARRKHVGVDDVHAGQSAADPAFKPLSKGWVESGCVMCGSRFDGVTDSTLAYFRISRATHAVAAAQLPARSSAPAAARAHQRLVKW